MSLDWEIDRNLKYGSEKKWSIPRSDENKVSHTFIAPHVAL